MVAINLFVFQLSKMRLVDLQGSEVRPHPDSLVDILRRQCRKTCLLEVVYGRERDAESRSDDDI